MDTNLAASAYQSNNTVLELRNVLAMINDQAVDMEYFFRMSAFEVCGSRECWGSCLGQSGVLNAPHALLVKPNA